MEYKLPERLFVPIETMDMGDETFWCNICDGGPVKSNDKSTGRFFSQHGHIWNVEKQKADEYEMIVFAICLACLNNETEYDGHKLVE